MNRVQVLWEGPRVSNTNQRVRKERLRLDRISDSPTPSPLSLPFSLNPFLSLPLLFKVPLILIQLWKVHCRKPHLNGTPQKESASRATWSRNKESMKRKRGKKGWRCELWGIKMQPPPTFMLNLKLHPYFPKNVLTPLSKTEKQIDIGAETKELKRMKMKWSFFAPKQSEVSQT